MGVELFLVMSHQSGDWFQPVIGDLPTRIVARLAGLAPEFTARHLR